MQYEDIKKIIASCFKVSNKLSIGLGIGKTKLEYRKFDNRISAKIE